MSRKLTDYEAAHIKGELEIAYKTGIQKGKEDAMKKISEFLKEES